MTNLQYCTEILGIIGDVSVAEDAIYQLGFDVYRKLGGQEDKPTIDTIYKELKQAISIWDNTDNLTITENGSYSLLGKTIDVSVACGPTPVILPADEIWYTSTDGNIVTPSSTDVFGANIISNTYTDGKGVIKFDDNVTSFGYTAFSLCTTLLSINVPDSVTEIGYHAFLSCNALESITIPESVISIDESFINCRSLTNVIIPKNVAIIKDKCFDLCWNIGVVKINSTEIVGNLSYTSSNNMLNKFSRFANGYIIGDDVTRIGTYAFYGNTNVQNITIGSGVTNIRAYAFQNCTGLTSLNIPNNVTSLGAYLCYGCTSLQSVTISNGISSIPGYCFSGCTNLSNITYNGTMEQWTALTKVVGWRTDVPATVVHCTDGDISIYTP